MSADNGIYILQTLDGYRVVHAQAIENLYWWYNCCDNPKIIWFEDDKGCSHQECENCKTIDPKGEMQQELNPQEIANYFGFCNPVKTEYEVMEHAKQIYDEIMDDDFCPIIEYGIQYIKGMENQEFPTHLVPEKEE